MNDAERAEIEARINLKPPEKPTGLWRRLRGRVSGETDFLNRIYEARKRQIPLNREILADGHIILHSLQPSAVVELLQCEDEGETYFFDIGDGQIFCLRHLQGGPDNDPERLQWPNTEFDIVRSQSHPLYFQQIWCRGAKLEPTRIIEPSVDLWDLLPEGDVFRGTLSTIEQDLASLAERQPT